MPNTRLEAVLIGLGDGAILEQIVADLLSRGEWNVDPTGTRGPDGGRDALLFRDDEQGILHCSIQNDWESKVWEDAEAAHDRPEKFDVFCFATTQNPGTIKRDRVEEQIREEYGWRAKILDLQRLRNRLRGDRDNHDLIREHLNIDPRYAFQDPTTDARKFYEDRIEQLQSRSAYYGSLMSVDERLDIEEVPILSVHIIPVETFGNDHDRLGSELPDPPGFHRGGSTDQYGDFVITGDRRGLQGDHPFGYYACFHEDGWCEAVTANIVSGPDAAEITYNVDKYIVYFLNKALDWYQQVGIHPPFRTYLTLIDAANYTIKIPKGIWGPYNRREFGEDLFTFGEVEIQRYDSDIPRVMRKPMNRLWGRAGWDSSLHYTEVEGDDELQHDWDPYGG